MCAELKLRNMTIIIVVAVSIACQSAPVASRRRLSAAAKIAAVISSKKVESIINNQLT